MKLILILLTYQLVCMANSVPVLEKNLLDCMDYGKVNILGSSECYIQEPCKKGEELLLDSTTKINGTYFIRPTCKKRLCPIHQYYWKNGNKCVTEDDKEYYCGPNANFEKDPFGRTFCECREGSYRLDDNPHQPCSILYSPGNCYHGYMIALEDQVARCIPNECYRREKYTGIPRIPYRGVCYDLGSQGPCRGLLPLQYDDENSPHCPPLFASVASSGVGVSRFGSCIEAGDGTCYSLLRSASFFRARGSSKRN